MNFSIIIDCLNNSHEEDLWRQEFTAHLIPSFVHLLICLTVGVIGNTFVFFIYMTKLRKTENRIFIPFLAGVDFFACVVTTVFFIIDTQFYASFPSELLCKIFYFFTFFIVMASLLLQLTIAIGRYIKICHPQKRRIYPCFEKVAVVGILVGSAMFAAPSVMFADVKQFDAVYNGMNVTGQTCRSLAGNFQQEREIVRMIIISVIVTGIIVACGVFYAKVGIVIYKTFPGRNTMLQKSKKQGIDQDFVSVESTSLNADVRAKHISVNIMNIQKLIGDDVVTNAQRKLRHHYRRRLNFNVMFMTMFVVYIAAWLPFITVMLFSVFHSDLWTSKEFFGVDINIYLIMRNFFVLAYCANPFIYSLFDSKFRSTLQRPLC